MPELRNFTYHVKLISKLFKDIYQGNKRVNQKKRTSQTSGTAASTQKSREGQSCLVGQMTTSLIWSRND